ncbi:MAG: formyltransferase family protein, partial [Actinomycetota bacterium]
MLRIAVLASGRGTNFQALHDACASGYLEANVVCVLTNKRKAGVIERAEAAGVEVLVLPHKGRDPLDVDEDIVRLFDERDVGLACNAGYMRVRGRGYCKALEGRAMNI